MTVDYVFCALCMVCPGRDVSWHRQDCKTLGQLGCL